MPFKSEAQHRKFRAMLADGEITQGQFDKWMDETKEKHGKDHPIKPLPEKVAFWHGFYKAATIEGQGKGFSATGEGSFGIPKGESVVPRREGKVESTTTDKTLLDRERNPRDYAHGEHGPEFTTPDGRIKY